MKSSTICFDDIEMEFGEAGAAARSEWMCYCVFDGDSGLRPAFRVN
jgi:hypothetical protein